MGLGILDRPIETVGQARIVFEGSEQHKLQQQQAQQIRVAKDKDAAGLAAKREQASLNAALDRQRSALGLENSVILEKQKQQGRRQLVQQKEAAGQTGGINVNIDPSLFQGVPRRQFGGPVQAGQPTIVGENGPELIVPGQDGQVIPTNAQDAAIGQQLQLAQADQPFDPLGQAGQEVLGRAAALRQEISDIDLSPQGLQGVMASPASIGVDGIDPRVRKKLLDSQAGKGRIPVDPEDLNKGFKDLPGTQAKTPEAAAKIQMLRTGLEAADDVERLIFNEDGSVNRQNLTSADVPLIGSIPFTEGRELRTKMEFGIQAITRAETGAAMPESEVENTRVRFMPRVGDSDSVVNLKLKMFRQFLNGSLDLIKKGDTPSLDQAKFNKVFETKARDDFKQRFLQSNPGATPEDADQFIRSTKKSFLPQ